MVFTREEKKKQKERKKQTKNKTEKNYTDIIIMFI